MTPTNSERHRYICGYVIHFKDGGDSEEQVLHQGTLQECKKIGALLPAVAYSGKRPVDRAEFIITRDDA